MAIHHRSSSRRVEDLRLTIDCLPVATRVAMLEGVREAERVIVGAYTDGKGGVCPMLAAHRRGGRTSFVSFAHAWDRFTRAGRRARSATRRELSILIGQLEGSLLSTETGELREAIVSYSASVRRRERAERDPTGEIVVQRAARVGRRRSDGRDRYSVSPGRMNMISGTTHAGEVFSR